MSDNIKVVVKVRPLISREIEGKLSYQWRAKNNTLCQIDQNGKDIGQTFTFDKVYDKDTETSDVYDDVAKPIVEAAVAGFNGTIFAYGQTSSGKTYTMTGTESSPGIIPMAVLNLFEIIRNIPDRDFLVRVSYIEIYNEKVRDLLNVEKGDVKVHDTVQGLKIDASEKVTSSPEEVLDAMKEGEVNRQKGATNMNEESSRSHSIFQITIESRVHVEDGNGDGCVNVSQLNLVDLAGSERAGQTGATGKRFIEGTHINKSLSALALVIKQLSEDPNKINKFVNYRDSKLTRILQNSLGGNAKTSIVCAVTPAAVEETISTLQFANRAKAIKNKPEVNAVATDKTMIQTLTQQMSKLQAQLESKKNLENDNYNLQKQIKALQRLILNGFSQRQNSAMIQGNRRKWQQPRRVTIHSTMSTIDDEPVIPIPKFCTPSLKYNPLVVCPGEPTISITKLCSVPEEPARLVTPPPIHVNDEVIDLDSEDDSVKDDTICSPIHKCYASSKTPPCVLRKNAKTAERNLKDIVELTEREKIFSPSAVELLEQLEQNSTLIAKLQDENDTLIKQSKETDLEVNALKSKIKINEDELQALSSVKINLQTQCNDYVTKLTDLEVSYETLKNKAKLREEELLSLLDEVRKPEGICKMLSRTLEKEINFMDMSKDISLVNSDNENSVINPDDETEIINKIVTDSRVELITKNQNIVELEANLNQYKEKIASLEKLTQDLNQSISVYKEKLDNMESENSLLKSSMDTLNDTIVKQNENLKTAHADIQSNNDALQELQLKLTQREGLSKLKFDDNAIEIMISNEEKFIANNENLTNIIYSLKNAIDSRNKEITELKQLQLNDNSPSLNEEITKLNSEVKDLQKQINENVILIDKLMQEKEYLLKADQELTEKLDAAEKKNNELEIINRYNSLFIKQQKDATDKLSIEMSTKDSELIERLQNCSAMLSQLGDLEKHCCQKDDIISSLKQEQMEHSENLFKAKTAVFKLQNILSMLSGNMNEVPDLIDNFVNIYTALSDNLCTLETVANNIVAENKELKSAKHTLNVEMEMKYSSETSTLLEQIESLRAAADDHQKEKSSLIEKLDELHTDLKTLRQKLDEQILTNENLESKLNEAIEQQNSQIQTNENKDKQFSHALLEKEDAIRDLTEKIHVISNNLNQKTLEISSVEERHIREATTKLDFMERILSKVSEITNNDNSDHNDTLNDSFKIYENIMQSLDKIAEHKIKSNLDKENSEINKELNKAKNEITELAVKNHFLEEKVSDIEKKNYELLYDVEKTEDETKELNLNLVNSNELLRDLQTELKSKAAELAAMQDKMLNWKTQFGNIDLIMKQEIESLKLENENLKYHIDMLRKQSDTSFDNLEQASESDFNNASNKRIRDLTMDVDTNSPPRLLTICCNKIVDCIDLKENSSKTATDIEVESQANEVNNCRCSELSIILNAAEEENQRLLDLLAEAETINQHLKYDLDLVRNELRLLVEPAQELQKKIVNHRTNLSILTATTYAENKLLKSQVKVLQHHHKRCHYVCQREIPDFKKQLSNLMTLLKGDSPPSEQQNLSFKRYSLPDVLDSSTVVPAFKNESTLDGDMLMLDTNITLTTAADNTLTGHDQTCLDMTQFYTEASSQTLDVNQITDQFIDEKNLYDQLNIVREENVKLRELLTLTKVKQPTTDTQSSPIKNLNDTSNSVYNKTNVCTNCKDLVDVKASRDKLETELIQMSETLNEIMSNKTELEVKYNDLVLETPTVDALMKKITIFDKENKSQKEVIAKLTDTVNAKNIEIRSIQEENDTLSTQVMENISEADDLNKQLDSLKQENIELTQKCIELEQAASKMLINEGREAGCSQCITKEQMIEMNDSKLHGKLNRSLSESDTTSRYNKICTLQNELHASREDCKELTEDVVTIKNHLERSDMAMDLDESMGDASIYSLAKGYENIGAQSKEGIMPNIPEECSSEIYVMDKLDCINYYVEKTGSQGDNMNRGLRIIDVMRMLYENLLVKHANEVQNLSNKLKDFEQEKDLLRKRYDDLVDKNSQVNKELEERNKVVMRIEKSILQIRNNISIDNGNINTDIDIVKLLNTFTENLSIFDNIFELPNAKMFKALIDKISNKHNTDLLEITEKYSKMNEHMNSVTMELNSVNKSLLEMQNQLSVKEVEYNLLKSQKERAHEISNAVTLDIVKREKELKDTFDRGYKRLIELCIVKPENDHSNFLLNTNINSLFDLLVANNKSNENERLGLELTNMKIKLEEKEKELDLLKINQNKLQEDYNTKESKLQDINNAYSDLKKSYDNKIEEDACIIRKLKDEIEEMRTCIDIKEAQINTLSTNSEEITKIIETVKDLEAENRKLKALNEMINSEKDSLAQELQKSSDTICKNNIDLDNMRSDILVLRESVKQNTTVIDNVNAEVKTLLKQNVELKEQLEIKCRECSRLETNIKTHEKTAQIQTRMIKRLEKQKTDDDQLLSDTKQQLAEYSQNHMVLQKEVNTYKHELDELRKTKEDFKNRILELEATIESLKGRPSVEATFEPTRNRRRSLYDSKRTFADELYNSGDHSSAEAVFDARPKPDDLFMDVDEVASNRSTPIRLSKGRDSLSLSRNDQSDKDEEHSSRPSSVMESRRRRQTLHDSHRNELSNTPSPCAANNSMVSQLKERLASTQQELEELKEKYKELDAECETCSEYLRESEKLCARLKKEKVSLQTTVNELQEKLQWSNPNMSQMFASKPNYAHASVNTDEDWTNLHSVVVDRMSYDAEVEKNKKLNKTIEELRFKKQDLKNTLAKMQKALDKNSGNRELEMTKMELQSCKEELSELKVKYKELDEECETCAQYMREKEEQCRRLKEAKNALESKLHDLESESASSHTLSLRKKRQSMYDQNRAPTVDVADSTTQTEDAYQVERAGNLRPLNDEKQAKEVKYLKLAVERLTQQKEVLEQQLVSVTSHIPQAMYVATGSAIIQNQQITDVMKENQKLKKINAKLVHMCKKRGKEHNRENEDPANQV